MVIPLLKSLLTLSHLALVFLFSAHTLADQDKNQRLQQRDALSALEKEQELLKEEREREQSLTVDGVTYEVSDTLDDLAPALHIAVKTRQWEQANGFLTRYKALEGYDPLLAHYALGALFRVEGKLAESEAEYQSLLALAPEFMPAKLELARVQFENQKNRDSLDLFKEIKRSIPQDNPRASGVIRTIDTFSEALEVRDSWQGAFSFGPSYNDNLNSSSESTVCLATLPNGQCWISQTTPDKESGFGMDYDASLNKRFSLSGHHGVKFNTLAYGLLNDGKKKYNKHTLITGLSYSYQSAKVQFSIGPQAEYNNSGDRTLYIAPGLKLDGFYSINNKSAAKVELKAEYQDYKDPDFDHYSDWLWTASGTYWYQLPERWLVFGGIDWNKKQSEIELFAYESLGGRLGVSRAFFDGWDISLFSSVKKRKHDGFNKILNGKREDKEQNHTLLITAKPLEFWGLTPTFTWQYQKVDSTLDAIYSYSQNEYSIKLEKRF